MSSGRSSKGPGLHRTRLLSAESLQATGTCATLVLVVDHFKATMALQAGAPRSPFFTEEKNQGSERGRG